MALEELAHGPRRLHRDDARTLLTMLEHGSPGEAGGEENPGSRAASPPRSHQSFPAPAFERPKHQKLHGGCRSLEGAEEPRGDDPALVHNQAISGAEPARQIGETC